MLRKFYIILLCKWGITLTWLINGFYAKVLNGVPRHQLIVGEILVEEYARELTFLIGLGEISIGVMVFFGIDFFVFGLFQIALILIMNILEVMLTPDLLLWGRYNIFFAVLFTGIIFYYYRMQQKYK